jgi:hypothetical protein
MLRSKSFFQVQKYNCTALKTTALYLKNNFKKNQLHYLKIVLNDKVATDPDPDCVDPAPDAYRLQLRDPELRSILLFNKVL